MKMAVNDSEQEIRRYSSMVYRLALARTGNPSDAEDVSQEVFLKYLQARITFANEEHRKAWLLRVTINQVKKLQASAWFRKTETLEAHRETRALPCERSEELEVWQAVSRLKPKYRTVIHLYYYEGYSAEEIARLLNRKPVTVRSQLARARQQLKEWLKEDE